MSINKKELVKMLEYFGYKKHEVTGTHNLYLHESKNHYLIMFAPLRSNQIVNELTLGGIVRTIVYARAASQKKVTEYLQNLSELNSRRMLSKKKRGKLLSKKKK